MKFTLAIALLFTSTLALADDTATAAATPEASSTPMTKENTSATAKKRLRHVGKNIEHLGHKAGEKAGVRKKGEAMPTDATDAAPAEVPAATPAH
jgi:hypothetical protein